MIRKSKSIEQIFEQSKGYDLVITNDAPLATALNRLVERPRLDYFAMTPRQIASKFSVTGFPRLYLKNEVIIEITKKTGQPLKIIHQNLEKIWEIWNHTGLLENLHKHFPEGAKLIPLIEKYPTIELAMERFDEEFYKNKKIAVAGIELFNLLDKQVLPKKGKYPDTIEIFLDENLEMEKTYLFTSFNELVNQTVALIDKKNQDDVAIVLNPDSDYLNVIKARLKENGIKLNLKEFLSSDIGTRNILSFISMSFEISDLKVSDILLLESIFDFIKIDRLYGNYYLSRFMDSVNKNRPLKSVYDFMNKIESLTFSEFFETLRKNYQKEVRPELIEVISQIGLIDSKITQDNINLISYYIRFIDAEIMRSNEGVLFVNALNSAFIDRPVVFFIGLDESWTKLNPEKSYLNREEEEQKNQNKFQVLLSQGKIKFNLALKVKENTPVNPCFYFNILSDRSIKGFEHDFFNSKLIRFPNVKNTTDRIEIPKKQKRLEEVTEISPSALTNFLNCPKAYSFSRMTSDEEVPHLVKGNLLHNFAEFYYNHPEYATEKFDFILENILDRYKSFVKKTDIGLEKTNFKIGMKILKMFIDEKKFTRKTSKENKLIEKNFLFGLTGKEKLYEDTENEFHNSAAKLKGKMDLFAGNIIVDYKSGRKRTVPTMLQEFKIENMRENLDSEIGFQTIGYIAGKRDECRETGLEFIYVYLLSEIKNFIADKFNLKDCISSVRYVDKTYKEFLSTKECFDFLSGKDRYQVYERLGFDEFKKIIRENQEKADHDDPDLMAEVFSVPITDYMREKLSLAKKDLKDEHIRSSVKLLTKLRAGTKEEGFIFKEDADNFLKNVEKAISEINLYQKSIFPNKPLFDLREVCKDCDFLSICIGNKLWSGNDISVKKEAGESAG